MIGRLITEILITGMLRTGIEFIENYNQEQYNCPIYCGINHEHRFLDSQSDLNLVSIENPKSSKIKDLATK